MSYMHIGNLYKERDILAFRRCFAMEKIHGTSAHVGWKDESISFFSGGADRAAFVAIFDHDALRARFVESGMPEVTVYGEAYGGKMQGMRDTYGPVLRFVAFEVKIGDCFLDVPRAEKYVLALGLDFVPYREVPTDIEALDAERDSPSVQAQKNGCGDDKPREGIVLRPPFEVTKNNGGRVIAKHKREVFRETTGPRAVNAEKLAILTDAQAIADEWITEQRLSHVLDAFPDAQVEQTGAIIKAMVEDVTREGEGEIVLTREATAAIGRATALMFKRRLQGGLR